MLSYGTLEGMYAALEDIRPALRKKLEAGREAAFLTRELSLLVADCQDIDIESGKLALTDDSALHAQMLQLGFRAFDQRLARWRATIIGVLGGTQ